jgi:hypothetical protein
MRVGDLPPSNASDNVNKRSQDEEKRMADEHLETLLLDGLRGEETELTRSDWKDVRAEALAVLTARRKAADGSR